MSSLVTRHPSSAGVGSMDAAIKRTGTYSPHLADEGCRVTFVFLSNSRKQAHLKCNFWNIDDQASEIWNRQKARPYDPFIFDNTKILRKIVLWPSFSITIST